MDANVELGKREQELGQMLVKYGRLTGDMLSVLVGKRMIVKGVAHVVAALKSKKRGFAAA